MKVSYWEYIFSKTLLYLMPHTCNIATGPGPDIWQINLPSFLSFAFSSFSLSFLAKREEPREQWGEEERSNFLWEKIKKVMRRNILGGREGKRRRGERERSRGRCEFSYFPHVSSDTFSYFLDFFSDIFPIFPIFHLTSFFNGATRTFSMNPAGSNLHARGEIHFFMISDLMWDM